MNKLIWILIAFISGALLPVQAGLNTRLGKSIQSPVYASMFSFLVGALVLIIYIAVTKQNVSIAGVRDAPPYVWIAGALGAFYVTATVLAFPQIGPALTFGLVVAGQMIIAVLLDHFSILVAQPHPVNIWRIAGIALVVAGVVLIRKS
jgi:transporter family-2 protein